ncbi:PREDICTED: CAMPATH-1 antigen [Propithecus coquereli]|uniref:CAMPATH-1 antigen n=1 Tax=Propithecus coquereli TaxID=379532 RepID=A0A2K6GU88_PROCO|nr:PREDICTED: CAMPATH-1 antigen [Propithecus coquereli]
MKGFLFLFLTISLLLMIQIQTGVLGNETSSGNEVLAFRDVGGGSFLFFLTNTLIHLFHLS